MQNSGKVINSSDLGRWFQNLTKAAPNRAMICHDGTTWTRQDMAANVQILVEMLKCEGIRSGDTISYLGTNEPYFLVTLLAAIELDTVFCPLPWLTAGDELLHIARDAQIKALVVGPRNTGQAEKLCVNLNQSIVYLSFSGLLSIERQRFEPLHSPKTARSQQPETASTAILMYTSGTTGPPKGVRMTHQGLSASIVNNITVNKLSEDDVAFVCCPLFHAAGLNSIALPVLFAGGSAILSDGFDSSDFIEAVNAQSITLTLLVPTMMHRLAQDPDLATADLTNLRLILSGGAPTDPSLLRFFAEHFIAIRQGYGMTETTSSVLILEPDKALSKIGSCGRPCLLTEIRLVGDDGKVIDAADTKGEIQLRGPTITPGYWNAPKATAAAIETEGWFKTGDVAYFDDEGFYYICDRLKDLIISGGENISASEVEMCLLQHPHIAEISVIGCPHPEWGEAVVACIVTSNGAPIDNTELRNFAAAHLARFKLPKAVQLLPRLPMTTTGKTSKSALRDMFADTFSASDNLSHIPNPATAALVKIHPTKTNNVKGKQ